MQRALSGLDNFYNLASYLPLRFLTALSSSPPRDPGIDAASSRLRTPSSHDYDLMRRRIPVVGTPFKPSPQRRAKGCGQHARLEVCWIDAKTTKSGRANHHQFQSTAVPLGYRPLLYTTTTDLRGPKEQDSPFPPG